jgi:hypothetical protein
MTVRRPTLLCLAVATALSAGCALGDDGPAPAASPAARAAARAETIAALAEDVRATAHELTSLTDESRRKVEAGTSSTADEIEKMRLLTAQLEASEAKLQAELQALEAELHTESGDPAWPQEEVPGRR